MRKSASLPIVLAALAGVSAPVPAAARASAALSQPPLSAPENPVKAGVDAWSAGDYAGAVHLWQPLADRGDPDALFNLAQAYKMGRGVPAADLARAEQLYGEAAAKGHVQAADAYGMLLFQRGERARALPYVKAAASRGDPRAQYVLGVAHFNGDVVPKDWVRAYALVSLAQQAGLPQANHALAQMDTYIPLGDRQKSVVLAQQLNTEAEANRDRLTATTELGNPYPVAIAEQGPPPVTPSRPASSASRPHISQPAAIAARPAYAPGASQPSPDVAAAQTAVAQAAHAAGTDRAPTQSAQPKPWPKPPQPRLADATPKPIPTPQAVAPQSVAKPVSKAAPTTAPVAKASGPWRVQLGAFGVPGNAEALWAKVRGRPELAGHAKALVPAGKLSKLQASGFASQADAQAACARLAAAGLTCIPVRD